jgi:hypothetical protein
LELTHLTAASSYLSEFNDLLLNNSGLITIYGRDLDIIIRYLLNLHFEEVYDRYDESGDVLLPPHNADPATLDFVVSDMGWLPSFISLVDSEDPEIRAQEACAGLVVNFRDTRPHSRHSPPRPIHPDSRNQLFLFSVYFERQWSNRTPPFALDLEQVFNLGMMRLRNIRSLSCSQNPGFSPGVMEGVQMQEIEETENQCYPLIDFYSIN